MVSEHRFLHNFVNRKAPATSSKDLVLSPDYKVLVCAALDRSASRANNQVPADQSSN